MLLTFVTHLHITQTGNWEIDKETVLLKFNNMLTKASIYSSNIIWRFSMYSSILLIVLVLFKLMLIITTVIALKLTNEQYSVGIV